MLSPHDERELRRARFIGRVRRELKTAFAKAKQRGITQADVAKRIDVDPAVVSRQLNGSANLTLSSIGDLAWALDLYPRIKLLTATELAAVGYSTTWFPDHNTFISQPKKISIEPLRIEAA